MSTLDVRCESVGAGNMDGESGNTLDGGRLESFVVAFLLMTNMFHLFLIVGGMTPSSTGVRRLMSTDPAEDEAEDEWGWSLFTLSCGVDGDEVRVDDEIGIKDLIRREWEGLRFFLFVASMAGGASAADLGLSDLSRLNERALTKRRMLMSL